MSNAQPTPGPWDIDVQGKVHQAGHTFYRVPLISPWIEDAFDASDAEALANVRLISAAPELLNAAEQALGDLQWIEGQDSRNNFQSSILLLKHAIAKATGERA